MKTLLSFALLTLSAMPLLAAETPWQEIAGGVKLRLISSGQIKADGHTLIGLEIDMPANTRTYWRVPGETGIPTQVDAAGSTGVANPTIIWPYPVLDERDGYTDYVYWGPTVLPIDLATTDATPQLSLSVVMGICSEVCIPAQAKFQLPLDFSTSDRANGLRIRQALALAPAEWTDQIPAIDSVSYDQAAHAIAVKLADPQVDPQSLIATSTTGDPLFGAPQKSPEPGLVLLPILGETGENGLANQSVQLTFMTSMGAFEVSRRVSASD
ncbi:protein-disulfide reductase DsbD domain-containing protein [Devosia sp.]|uniref:protein-disulfide reductase DsbD domain-containing protein n=1 Tax=Devosia sp. TaxID=1871048 RepID=UPI003266D4A7